MKIIIAIASLVSLALIGCAPANITAVKWDTGITGNVITRCEQLDMRDKQSMDAIFTKYDGWKLVYISEYTSEHKVGTDAAVCFERAK